MSESSRTVSRDGGGRHQAPPPVRVPVPSMRPPTRGLSMPGFGAFRFSGGGALRILTWAALALAIVVFALVAIGPRTGTYRLATVLSDSMKPHWEAGDVVVSRPIAARDLKVGDVITFNAPIDGRPSITHRVISLTEPGDHPVVRTKGDANNAEDTWGAIRLGGDGTVYRITRSIPNAGLAFIWLKQRSVRLIATGIVPVLLLLLILWHIWKPAVRPVGAGA